MSQEFNVTLNIAQLIMLGGLIWGVARMSKSVDVLGEVTTTLTVGLEKIGEGLAALVTRVGILEDRSQGRRRSDREDA